MSVRNISLVIAVILGILATLSFLLVGITVNFIIGYVFVLLGIAGLFLCTNIVLKSRGSYPWILTVPITAFWYLVVSFLVSALVVALEQFGLFVLPSLLFVVLHCVLLAVFLIQIPILKKGTEYISEVDSKSSKKVNFIRTLQTDIELLADKEHDAKNKQALASLAEKIRYSDPVSAAELFDLENTLSAKLAELKVATDKQPIVEAMNDLLTERNAKCKMMK